MRLLYIVLAVILSVSSVLAEAKKLPTSNGEIQLSFSKTVKKVSPAVVNVFSTKIAEQRRSVFGNDPFFNRFFDNQFGAAQSNIQKSLGSGVIVNSTGLLVTNHHVVKGSTKIRVVLTDLREFDARIILEDERTDLAILQIMSNNETFSYLEFADSDNVEVGDLALALGNPYGVGQTVTSGIVSAIARTNVGISDFQFFIQTDAAINPGNSGGALVDSLGRLIGINTAIYSRSGGSNGIGFAIPSNMVKLVVNSSKQGDRVLRPWLGAELQSISHDIALSLGMDKTQGVLIRKLSEDSPLYLADIMPNDVIVAVDSKVVKNKEQLIYLLASQAVGETVYFSVYRGDRILDIDVELIAAPETPARHKTVIKGRAPFAGAEVMNISPAVIEEMTLPLNAAGVIISNIARNSNAHRNGFRVGDIVISVSDQKIELVGDLIQESRHNKRLWHFKYVRNGRITSATIYN